jgi:6-pyruvoyltetrahydropterin/6-carboxytetrahydropterin synthase
MTVVNANRYHDFSYGHCVTNHESHCYNRHGHNGRVTFYCEADKLDSIGRVIDFSVIKEKLCMWVENNFDHKFLMFKDDPRLEAMKSIGTDDMVICDWNPTAENMAEYLLNVIGPQQLEGTNVRLVKVIMEETRKCGVEVTHV